MIAADCQPGVVSGTLDSAIQRLRRVLNEYRTELQQAESAFDEWTSEWRCREREIDTHLQRLQARLQEAGAPQLNIIRVEE